MRSRYTKKQDIYFAVKTEASDADGDLVATYGKPEMHRGTVSMTAGQPFVWGLGFVPAYSRYITSFDKNFTPTEGMVCWVDVTPTLNADGTVALGSDGISPVVPPDYVIKRIIKSQKAPLRRYALRRLNGTGQEVDENGS